MRLTVATAFQPNTQGLRPLQRNTMKRTLIDALFAAALGLAGAYLLLTYL